MPIQSCSVLYWWVTWAEWRGSSARVSCCKQLQQDKARMAATALSSSLFRAILHCKVEALQRNSNAFLSYSPIFLLWCVTQVLQGFFFLSRQGAQSCNTSGFIYVLFAQVSPFWEHNVRKVWVSPQFSP